MSATTEASITFPNQETATAKNARILNAIIEKCTTRSVTHPELLIGRMVGCDPYGYGQLDINSSKAENNADTRLAGDIIRLYQEVPEVTPVEMQELLKIRQLVNDAVFGNLGDAYPTTIERALLQGMFNGNVIHAFLNPDTREAALLLLKSINMTHGADGALIVLPGRIIALITSLGLTYTDKSAQ